MNSNYATFMNVLSPYWERFNASTKNLAEHQASIALDIIHRNSQSHFGTKHSFEKIASINDYQKQVPLQDYTSLSPYINDLAHGAINSLTSDNPVTHFELTSGSTDKIKTIPYTKALCNQFFHAIAPWLYNLYSNKPELTNGKFFWVLSPANMSNTTKSNSIPIGESNDAIYFPESIHAFLAESSALSFQKAEASSFDLFMIQQIASLLGCKDLRWLSLWNPSYMHALFNYIKHDPAVIFSHIENLTRRRFVITAWKENEAHPARFFATVWTKLSFLSCWKDGAAAHFIPELTHFFPNVSIQGKGLMATEGIVSFPLLNQPGHVLATNSHFLEFICMATQEILLAHEIELNKQYEVVLTTAGGLYRYQLHDVIEVVGFYNQAPLIKFIGRNRVLDLVGEKLHEQTLSDIVIEHTKNLPRMKFLMLAPEQHQDAFYYHLYVVADMNSTETNIIAESIEKDLKQYYHYNHARNLQQLQALRISRLKSSTKAHSIVQRFYQHNKKVPLSMIKSSYIEPTLGWNKRFSEILIS